MTRKQPKYVCNWYTCGMVLPESRSYSAPLLIIKSRTSLRCIFSVVASPLEPECQCIVLPPSARGSSFVLSNVRNSSSKDDSKLSVRLRNWFAFLWGQFVIWEPKLAYCWLLNDDPIEQKRSSVGISQKKLRQVAVSPSALEFEFLKTAKQAPYSRKCEKDYVNAGAQFLVCSFVFFISSDQRFVSTLNSRFGQSYSSVMKAEFLKVPTL